MTDAPVVLGEAELDGVTAGSIDRVTVDPEPRTEATGGQTSIGIIKINPGS